MNNIAEIEALIQHTIEMRLAQNEYDRKQCGRTYKQKIFWQEKVDEELKTISRNSAFKKRPPARYSNDRKPDPFDGF